MTKIEAIEYIKARCIGSDAKRDGTQWSDAIWTAIEALRTAQEHEETFEWCDGCKEYDKENHCCHRWDKVIRTTLKDLDVVNCCGCVYWKTDGGAIMECELSHMPTNGLDYCSYGKRSE